MVFNTVAFSERCENNDLSNYLLMSKLVRSIALPFRQALSTAAFRVVGSRFFSGESKTGPELTGGNQAYPSNGYRHVKFNKVSARVLFGFFYSYVGYLFIFCPEWLLGLLWPSLNVMS